MHFRTLLPFVCLATLAACGGGGGGGSTAPSVPAGPVLSGGIVTPASTALNPMTVTRSTPLTVITYNSASPSDVFTVSTNVPTCFSVSAKSSSGPGMSWTLTAVPGTTLPCYAYLYVDGHAPGASANSPADSVTGYVQVTP